MMKAYKLSCRPSSCVCQGQTRSTCLTSTNVLMPNSSLVRKANKVSSSQLLGALSGLHTTRILRVLLSAELREPEKDAIWRVFEDNMHNLYSQSSFGWDPPSKRAELFDPLSRFVLIETDGHMVAFSMFRFESEEDEDVLYCYDLQIHRSQQRNGLGTLLIHALEAIGTAWRMQKVALTVFKTNLSAIKFYEAAGYYLIFTMDETSPNYLEDGENSDDLEYVDYDILSKRLALS
ncbi:hypothetical protein D9615_005342 [Tricholomella constricta]|uniref:N-alpha-acetyltransferase 40 n=1 Tax=Tricholomella constricta TaxID=117010 RepID=A0A8H5M173_9AGAR|nr:hypothetical protein D9615_005342 [Tricholomella constricta]